MLNHVSWSHGLLVLLIWLPSSAAIGQTLKTKLDQFGNPEGDVSLAGRNEFKGKRLLVWTIERQVAPIYAPDNPLWQALKDKGFKIELKATKFDSKWLKNADQLWIFAGQTEGLSKGGIQAIEKFVRSGHGLYLVSDNAPFLVDANTLCQRLFGVGVSGDYKGDQIIAVRGRGITRDDYQKSTDVSNRESRLPSDSDAPKIPPNLQGRVGRLEVVDRASHYVADHALLTGINFLYEGITISHIDPSPKLQTVLTASDGQILAAVAKDPSLPVLVDCGFTRYLPDFVNKTAGTLRYAENIAAWLMGKGRRTGGPGDIVFTMQAIDSGDASQADRAALAKLSANLPKYRDIKEQLPEIWRLAASSNAEVAEAAHRQMVNAFQRAPLGDCLRWLASDDAKLCALIWEQLDDRIARADDERKASYRDGALEFAGDESSPAAARGAAVELLGRLDDKEAVGPLIELLPRLPREALGKAGKALEKLTGERFGPKSGDGVAELNVSVKKWRAWWEDQPRR